MWPGDVFQFGDFRLDVVERRLERGSQAVRLPPKSLDVLIALVHANGRLMTKRDLLSVVWPDAFVEEGILTVHISALRKVLKSDPTVGEWIETVPRAGYRFAGAVRRVMSAASDRAPSRTPTEVQALLAVGRSSYLTGSSVQMPTALAAYRAALEIDPTCASAHAGLALTRCAQAYVRAVPHAEAYADAKAAALRALAMDSMSADAQAALGTVLFSSEWDWAGARRSLQRALDIAPDHTEALLQYGALHDALGDLAQGLRLKQQALHRASQSPLVLMEMALSYALQRKYDEARLWARKALALDPGNQRAAEFMTVTCWFVGDIDGVLAEKRRRADAIGMDRTMRTAMERRLAALRAAHSQGSSAAARFLLENFATGDDSRASMQRAALYAALGETDAAFANLERAIAARDPTLVYLRVHALWDPLRHDRRMMRLLSQVGLSDETAIAAS
jgi:DNA-binding winged helix-turn-helix (wHTH) protein